MFHSPDAAATNFVPLWAGLGAYDARCGAAAASLGWGAHAQQSWLHSSGKGEGSNDTCGGSSGGGGLQVRQPPANATRVRRIVEALRASGLVQPGGVMTTLVHTGQQWVSGALRERGGRGTT